MQVWLQKFRTGEGGGAPAPSHCSGRRGLTFLQSQIFFGSKNIPKGDALRFGVSLSAGQRSASPKKTGRFLGEYFR
jgi:hypothetical protein